MIIVVADDADRFRNRLSRALLDQGHDVLAVADAEQLRGTLGALQPDAIFADLFLPGLSALALELRLKAQGRHIPVVMMVANSTEASIVRRSSGARTINRYADEALLGYAAAAALREG